LAYTVCDVKKLAQGFEMQVNEWKRIAVVGGLGSNVGDVVDEDDPYGPKSLSKTAHHLVKDVLWPYNADTVLIERQRFRSGGGSAVQEWTLRVNMLESMIWAIAQTLEAGSGGSKQKLWPVNPKQVANFWVGGTTSHGRASMGKAKIEKRQKIELVRKWLSGETENEMSVKFVDDAAEMKRLFLAAASGQRVPKSDIAVDRISKLDDLADCLLQAAAWCKWEDNRSRLAALINLKEQDRPLDHETLQHAVDGKVLR
jgi:cruciform cutting endonuclease 1